MSGNGGGCNDATSRTGKMRMCALCQQPGRPDIDCKGSIVICGGHIQKTRALDDAGVADEHIESAEALDCHVDNVSWRVRIRDVRGDRFYLSALDLQQCSNVLKPF